MSEEKSAVEKLIVALKLDMDKFRADIDAAKERLLEVAQELAKHGITINNVTIDPKLVMDCVSVGGAELPPEALIRGLKGGWYSPNDVLKVLGLPNVKGGHGYLVGTEWKSVPDSLRANTNDSPRQ
jgi:hypothetical protein